MLVKEELLRELILLLLRSLENRNPRDWSQPGPFPPHCSSTHSAAVGHKQQHGMASKGPAGLSHRVIVGIPLSPLSPMPTPSRGCQHPGAEHRCQPAVSRCGGELQRDIGGSLHTAKPLFGITHHRGSPCPRPQVPAAGLSAWAPAPSYLHKLQVLEGRELPWDLSELVSIQVAARENESTSRWLRSRKLLSSLSHLCCTDTPMDFRL